MIIVIIIIIIIIIIIKIMIIVTVYSPKIKYMHAHIIDSSLVKAYYCCIILLRIIKE